MSSTRTSSSRSTGATRCWASSARASRTSRSAGRTSRWGIPFPIGEDGQTAQREDGSWDVEAGTIYVWFDALINYITGAGFPNDLEAFQHWWPADLHVIGKDIARFHAIYWPAMLWSAGIDAPRHVWVHGFMHVQGERMSKSRGNFFDPNAMVSAFGADGTRYVTLREIPFDRDSDVSWDSFVRRYNADLANDFGNLVNRTVTMVNRYLGGERPAPRAAADSPLGAGWPEALGRYQERLEGCRLHDALAELWEFVGSANKTVDAEQPWTLNKAAQAGDAEAAAGCGRCWATSSRRAGSSASRSRRSCRRWRRASSSSSASPTATRPTATVDRRSSMTSPGAPRRRRGGYRHADAAVPAHRERGCRGPAGLIVRLVDSHGHVNADRFADDVDLVLGAARLAGVERILVPGWNHASSERALALADRYPWLDAAAGVHPHDAAKATDADWAAIEAWSHDERVVAIGETGLDSDRMFSPWEAQLENLRRNLALALATGKPAILHCRSKAGARDAQDALLAELRSAGFDGPAAERRSRAGRPP